MLMLWSGISGTCAEQPCSCGQTISTLVNILPPRLTISCPCLLIVQPPPTASAPSCCWPPMISSTISTSSSETSSSSSSTTGSILAPTCMSVHSRCCCHLLVL